MQAPAWSMVSVRLVRRRSTSPSTRGHRPLVQGTRAVPRSSTSVPRPARPTSASDLDAAARSRSSRWLLRVSVAASLGLLAALAPALPAAAAPATVSPGPAIEGLAPYQGQTLCDPVARPGAVRLRDLVLASYPGTGDSGITRPCTVGGASEHKEGRSWDWRVSTADPVQVAQVDELMTWLLAPDEFGNTAAMARRLGVMYMIWDSQVWKSYQAGKGWQRYVGASPHTDHVHFSLSWAGAYAQTSYWTGTVAPVMPPPAKQPVPAADAPTAEAPTSDGPTSDGPTSDTPPGTTATEPTSPPTAAAPTAAPGAAPSAAPSAKARAAGPPAPAGTPTPKAPARSTPAPKASATSTPAPKAPAAGPRSPTPTASPTTRPTRRATPSPTPSRRATVERRLKHRLGTGRLPAPW